jgi:SAM-dependent methyltransferase
MGINTTDLTAILSLARRGLLPRGGKILSLGAQNLYCAGEEQALAEFLAAFGASSSDVDLQAMATGYAHALFERVGFSYTCFDVYPAPCGVVFDLNNDELPASMVGAFDLVLNNGTTEHLIDQRRAFELVHRCTRAGGLMLHNLPFQGYLDHGFFGYTGKFFHLLARFNEYQAVDISFREGEPKDVPEYVVSRRSELGGTWRFRSAQARDSEILCILRKVRAAPFLLPLDVDASRVTAQDIEELRRKQVRSSVPPDRATRFVLAAETVLQLGHVQAARECYERATVEDRSCTAAWIGLGKLLLEDRPGDALTMFARALDTEPRNEEALVGGLRAARRGGDREAATVLAQVLGTFHPGHPAVEAAG